MMMNYFEEYKNKRIELEDFLKEYIKGCSKFNRFDNFGYNYGGGEVDIYVYLCHPDITKINFWDVIEEFNKYKGYKFLLDYKNFEDYIYIFFNNKLYSCNEFRKKGILNCGWILSSEKIPVPFGKSVLIYTKDGGVAEGHLNKDGTWIQYRWSTKFQHEDVICWRELPNKPYNIDESEE